MTFARTFPSSLSALYGSDQRSQRIKPANYKARCYVYIGQQKNSGHLAHWLGPCSVHSVFFVTLNVMAGNLLLARVMSGPGRFGETLPPPPANIPRARFDRDH